MKAKRGDVVLAIFPHAAGTGAKKRPVLVIQSDSYNLQQSGNASREPDRSGHRFAVTGDDAAHRPVLEDCAGTSVGYILDPADVYGPDFPGETFRVLKEKEQAKFGEYRTRRLVLEAWDREEGKER